MLVSPWKGARCVETNMFIAIEKYLGLRTNTIMCKWKYVGSETLLNMQACKKSLEIILLKVSKHY